MLRRAQWRIASGRDETHPSPQTGAQQCERSFAAHQWHALPKHGLLSRHGPAAGHGLPPHSAPVIPLPSVMVKMRSTAGSLTVSFAPEGQ